MTILNHTNEGLPSELIVLTRAIFYSKEIKIDDLISICSPPKNNSNRLRGCLLRWIKLGLFERSENDIVKVNAIFTKDKKILVDEFTNRLPFITQQLALENKNAVPLLPTSFDEDDNSGVSADFVRGVSWLLAQNIYNFPTKWEGVELLQNSQIGKIISNDVRWGSLRRWCRYLGFATGDSSSFQIDPTKAINDQLPFIFADKKELNAHEFLAELCLRLPVLDGGVYRLTVESRLDIQKWRRPKDDHLSMSLSLALRRLALNGTITLVDKADGIKNIRLTGFDFQSWISFKYVIWNGGSQ